MQDVEYTILARTASLLRYSLCFTLATFHCLAGCNDREQNAPFKMASRPLIDLVALESEM